MRHCLSLVMVCLGVVLCAPFAGAVPVTQRVAVLNMAAFQDARSQIDFGVKLADQLSDRLAVDASDLVLIERGAVQSVLQDFGLNVEGFIDPSVARRLGRVLEADVLVIGRWISTGHRVLLSVRVIWPQTGKTQTLIEKAYANKADKALFVRLSKRIRELVDEHKSLVWQGPLENDRLYDALRESLAGYELPTITVTIDETFLNEGTDRREAESHVRMLLQDLDFSVDKSWQNPTYEKTEIQIYGVASVYVVEQDEHWATVLADVQLVARDLYRMQVLSIREAQVIMTEAVPEYAARNAVSDATDLCLRLLLPEAIEKWHSLDLYP